MKALFMTAVAVAGLQFSGSALANGGGERCSTSMLAGRWFFATGIGHQTLANAPAPGDITAIGTMTIRRNGDLEGGFDVTFEGAAFAAGVPYAGSVTVNPDCTGTLSFVTGTGSARTDSIVVLNRYEIWGMSQDPNNLWTYRARRLAGRRGFAHD
jgi:hypothetical protein